MTEPLLTISAFARAVGLSPSALRYYDEAGVLLPAEVDPHTGYRYYTPTLERRARMIARMRQIGVPVETMRLVLDSSPERAADILKGIADQATEAARRAAAAVMDVVASLRAENAAAGSVSVPVDGPELAVALRQISVAASREPDSPLGVVLVDIEGSQVSVVATNRYWLAVWSVPPSGVHVGERRVAIPLGEVDGLATWLSRQGTVTLAITPEGTRISGDEEQVTVTTADDRFPAYRAVVDQLPSPCGRATVERAPLLRLVRDDKSPIRVAAGRERLTVSPEDGVEGAHLPAVTVGEPFTVGFSSVLLRSALTAIVSPSVTLWYAAEHQAVRFTSAYQRNVTALVMPVRLDR